MFKQQSPFPTRKVWGATTMAALATLLAALSKRFLGFELDADLQAALVIVLTALAAYFIPPAEIDGIRSTQSKPI